MFKLGKIVALVAVAMVFISSNFAMAVNMVTVNGKARPSYREGEVIVKYRDNAMRTMNSMEALYQRLNVLEVRHFSGNFKNFEHLMFNTSALTVEQAVADLKRDPSVEYAQPNYMIYALNDKVKPAGEPCIIPGFPFPPGCDDSGGGGGGEQPTPPPANGRPAIAPLPNEAAPGADADLSKAWGILKTSADKAWATSTGSKNVIVAVIDTGIDYNHADLAFNVWRNPAAAQTMKTGVDALGDTITGDVVGWDFIHNDNLPFDDNQHGTHCAGVIGAVGNDGQGISGINQRVSIMGVKFLSGEGSGDTAGAIKGVDYAVSRGAKVLSNSWGGKGDDGQNQALQDAINRAGQAGVLFVAAAGNDGTNNDSDPVFPASFNLESMVNVAATTETDGLAYFSNTGVKTVHLGAPGTNVYSTTPGGKYAKLSGTSMACPHVAGAAALLWSKYPDATVAQVKAKLMSSGDSISALSGKTISGKRLNVQHLLEGSL